MFDDVEGRAVFDAAAGVLEFRFAQDGAAGLFAERGELDEWGVADGADEGVDGALRGGDVGVVGCEGVGCRGCLCGGCAEEGACCSGGGGGRGGGDEAAERGAEGSCD